MATVKRETTVGRSSNGIWSRLINDPNGWSEWLTPLRGIDEKVGTPVAAGQSFPVRLGNLSAKMKVVEATEGRKLRWKAGPGPLLAMGMGMKGTLEFESKGESTHVQLTMKSPPMMRPMMQSMTGLNTAEEMTKTIERIKELSEQQESA